MADDLVVASLTFDASGMATGAKQAADAMTEIESGAGKAGTGIVEFDNVLAALEHRMTSARHIAMALLGSFTVAGAIVEVSNFTKSIIENSEAFQSAKDSIADWYHEIILGEGVLDRLIARYKDLDAVLKEHDPALLDQRNIAAATKEYDALLEKEIGLKQKAADTAAILASGNAGVGASIIVYQERLAALNRDAAEADRIAVAYAAHLRDLTSTQESSASVFADVTKHVADANRHLEEELRRLDEAHKAIPKAFKLTGNIFEETTHQALKLAGAMDFSEPLHHTVSGLSEFQKGLDKAFEKMTLVRMVSTEVIKGFNTMGDAIGAAFSGEKVSGDKIIRDLLEGIAKKAAVQGVYEIAEGFAALAATWGAPNPSSEGHFTAAAEYFAAAALAGGGAQAFGGSSHGSSGGPSRATALPAPAPGQQQRPGVTYDFSGATVMTQSPAEFVRWLRAQERKMVGMNV